MHRSFALGVVVSAFTSAWAQGPTGGGTGRVLVDCAPKATVQLDDTARGTTPLALDSVPAGKHTLTLTDVASKRTKKVDIIVVRDQTTVHVDRLPYVVALPEGLHVLKLTRDDKDVSTTVEVEVGADYVAVVTPPTTPADEPGRRPGAAKRSGRLTLKTDPWTSVYWEGRNLGQTPLVDYAMPVGSHMLRLINEERNISTMVQVDIPADKSVVTKDLNLR